MPTSHTLIAFAVVSVTLIVLPGPANFFILGHGISQGRESVVRAVLGITTASAVRLLLTIAGLSAVLATSAAALTVIRWAGAGYFLYLAARALRGGRARVLATGGGRTGSMWRSFRKGFAVGIRNPKTLLFFLAFFPQFVQAGRGAPATQMLILGLVNCCIGATWDFSLALASSALGRWLDRRPHISDLGSRAEATTYLGLAVYGVAT